MNTHDLEKLRAVLSDCHSLLFTLTNGGPLLAVQIKAMTEDERSFKELAKLKSDLSIMLQKIEDEAPRP